MSGRFSQALLGRARGIVLAGALSSLVVALWASPALAQRAQDGPFAPLSGAWSGTGTITMSSGERERIRCQADYRVTGRTNVLLQLACASDTYRFELQSDTIATGATLSGSWNELTRHVSGQVAGRVTGNRIEMRAESQTFTALLDMTTRGNQQSVSIRSPGSAMSDVSISLTRRAK